MTPYEKATLLRMRADIDRMLKNDERRKAKKKGGGFTVRQNVKPQKDTRNARQKAEAKAIHAGKGKKRSDTL